MQKNTSMQLQGGVSDASLVFEGHARCLEWSPLISASLACGFPPNLCLQIQNLTIEHQVIDLQPCWYRQHRRRFEGKSGKSGDGLSLAKRAPWYHVFQLCYLGFIFKWILDVHSDEHTSHGNAWRHWDDHELPYKQMVNSMSPFGYGVHCASRHSSTDTQVRERKRYSKTSAVY